MPTTPWKAIAAMSENRVIGHNNTLPWHIPEDFKWVKSATSGKAIAMGRKTFESMGRPLPNRQNIVISRSSKPIEGCVVLPSLEALEAFVTDKEVWIFGGSSIYEQALDRIDVLYLTIVRGSFQGDAYFPAFEDRFVLEEVLRSEEKFEIRKYVQNLSA